MLGFYAKIIVNLFNNWLTIGFANDIFQYGLNIGGVLWVNVKSQLLRLLANGSDSYFSGTELAGQLSVSRSAVWKGAHRVFPYGFFMLRSKSFRRVESIDDCFDRVGNMA